MLAAKIFFPIRHTQWIKNLVPIRKKNRDIRIRVDFRKLNKDSQNENCPIPPMEKILNYVPCYEMLSLLDYFLGYNEVMISNEDQVKTTFRTKWGTYSYIKIPFVLINDGVTFQRAMDISF
jgi:hypothetical protein